MRDPVQDHERDNNHEKNPLEKHMLPTFGSQTWLKFFTRNNLWGHELKKEKDGVKLETAGPPQPESCPRRSSWRVYVRKESTKCKTLSAATLLPV
jgi:hypothetical protein